MVSLLKITFFSAFCAIFASTAASRVLELSDRFLEVQKDGQWLIMMYAPWCAHCKRLEPIWGHVAQHLHATPIRVGRVDCTRFVSVAQAFKINGFPTILFLKGEQIIRYNGDRTKDELIKFALRLSGPPVQEITRSQSFETLNSEQDLYFLHVGERTGFLWDIYERLANEFQAHAFFYQTNTSVAMKHVPLKTTPTIFVYKENSHYHFTGHDNLSFEVLNNSMYKWVNRERFPTFPKVTRGNIHQLFLTNKNLVLAVVEENQLDEIQPDMIEFRDMVESVIKNEREKYHDDFQFGWVANPDLANSIATMVVPLPSLIVINTTTHYHYIPEDEPRKLTSQAIKLFLEQIHNGNAPTYGGNSWMVRVYRSWFEFKTTLAEMWKGNPILTMVLFGLPFGFLLLICYSICCADILDADDEEEEEDGNHMKRD